MQTFLPWPDFEDSAACLDRLRLGKQRVETMQILNVLVSINPDLHPPNELSHQRPGWVNHPAVLMWKGYEHALCNYGIAVCEEWKARGYRDGVYNRFREHINMNVPRDEKGQLAVANMPWWFGDDRFHASHRAMLVKKDRFYYEEMFPPIDPSITDYWWPSKNETSSN